MIVKLSIENYKSIRLQEVEFNHINILIGPNGAGKSNLISLFSFLEHLSEQQLQTHIFKSGGINNFLYKGYEESEYLKIQIDLSRHKEDHYINIYQFTVLSDGEKYQLESELVGFWDTEKYDKPALYPRSERVTREAILKNAKWNEEVGHVAQYVYSYLKNLRVFHFHDTSDNAPVKLPQQIEDVYFYRPEGENLAPLLMHFKEYHYETYNKIVETVRLVYPFFQDFVLEENPMARGKVSLRWKENNSLQIFNAKQISDGTLRFICLATLLIQPANTNYTPDTIVLDEPELGLHPFAIQILTELIQKTSLNKQLIIATQNVNLINYFEPEDLLIVERNFYGATEFRRLENGAFESWLDDYSLGQLWEKNFLGGRP